MKRGICTAWYVSSENPVDDFITFGLPASQACSNNLRAIKAVAHRLGVPLAVEKEEVPTSRLTFLGIHIDTVEGVLSLPLEKLERARRELRSWVGKRWC